MLVCSLGDLTLDVVVRLAGPIAVGGDTDAVIRLGPGGQAANVAAWAATLGASARFVGKTGEDDAGTLARSRLASYGVEVVGAVEGRGGTICSLVSPEGERSMAADRGSAADLLPDVLDGFLAEEDVLGGERNRVERVVQRDGRLLVLEWLLQRPRLPAPVPIDVRVPYDGEHPGLEWQGLVERLEPSKAADQALLEKIFIVLGGACEEQGVVVERIQRSGHVRLELRAFLHWRPCAPTGAFVAQ